MVLKKQLIGVDNICGSNFINFLILKCLNVLLVAQDMENISEDDGWEFVNLGDQQSFGIKTAGLEEKATACQMLVSHPLQNSAEMHECSALQDPEGV